MPTLASALCLTLTAIVLQAQSSTRTPDFAETRRLMRDWMAKDSATAAAIAVVRDGAIIWEEGFGWADQENRLPATPKTPFLLASLTKTFEATLAAVLSAQRRLDLDGPVNDYLRTTGISSPAWDTRDVTIRRLLMNMGGLGTFDLACDAELPRSRCRFPTADETIRQFGFVVRRPGAHFDYSNLGYFVASEAMARAAGRPLREVLRDEVFRPLGMTHASVGLDSAQARLVAVPFSWVQGLVREQPSAADATDYASARGYASAHDLALFGAFHLKAHRRDQRAILSDAAIDSMQYSTVSTGRADGQRYALGWWVEEDRFGYRSVLAQGGNDRAQAWLRLIPSERVAVAVLVNKGVGFAEWVTDAAVAAVLPRYAEGLAAHERERGTAQGSAPSAATPTALDSTLVGVWSGRIRTADRDIPLELAIAANGKVHARVAERRDVGSARLTTTGRLFVRIPGDLEAPNPAGKNRLMRLYLNPLGAGFGGAITTRPPSALGLDGSVSYWAEITRRR